MITRLLRRAYFFFPSSAIKRRIRVQATRFVLHLIDAILEMSIGMEAKMQKWEYATVRFEGDIEAVDAKVVIHRGRELEERDPKRAGLPNVLAELGDEGWEAITMTHLTKRLITILFKRPLEPETKKENNSEKFWEFVRRRRKVQN